MYFATLEDAQQIYSDMFKDANGFRPRNDRSNWTLENFNEMAEELQVIIEDNIREREKRTAKAVAELKTAIARCKQYGAKDDADALRWLLDAENVRNKWDFEEWVYNSHIEFSPYAQYLLGVVQSNNLIRC